MVSPSNAVVMPWSWALLYLPTIMQTPFADRTLSEREKLGHASCITTIVPIFCKILDNLESAVNSYAVNFNSIGRRNMPAYFVKRRNADLLTTLVLNLSHWPNAPKGFSETWTQMRKVFDMSLFCEH